MARQLDPAQQQELTDFVNELFGAAGYKKTADWARDSGYPAPNLSNLRNAKGGVDGYNLLRLIRAAAARTNSTPEVLALDLARVTVDGSPASIDGHLRELSDLVKQALGELELLARERGAQRRTGADRREGRRNAQ
jgi:hypothetical protein